LKLLLKNGHVVDYYTNVDKQADVLIEDGKISKIGSLNVEADETIDCTNMYVIPGMVDMHCHLREPGFEHKEDIATGVNSAVKGGWTSVACMPNTNPPIDNEEIINYIIDKSKSQEKCNVFPIACITKEHQGKEVVDMSLLKSAGAVAFSDDGKPVVSAKVMKEGMKEAYKNNCAIISHCEELTLGAGSINDGKVSKKFNLQGVPREAEEIMVLREIALAEANDLRVHIAHISTKGSAQYIREAKKRGVKVTCETCPHYFSLTDEFTEGKNPNAKMNPPLRTEEDKKAIIEAIKDGTVDAIATDHAPHSEEEKAAGIEKAPNGILGFETALKLVVTNLVDKGYIDYKKAVELLSYNPAQILNINRGILKEESIADITIFNPDTEEVYTKEDIVSKSKNSPFIGMKLKGKVMYTIVNGKIVYKAN